MKTKAFSILASLMLALLSTEAHGEEVTYIDHTVDKSGATPVVTAVERTVTIDGTNVIDGDGLAACLNTTSGNVEVYNKTVVITKDHKFTNPVVISGTLNLILCDGVTFTCTAMINVASGHTLNIYGQTLGTGKLVVTSGDYNAGIGSIENISAGKINIHGGDINATGGYYGAGIGGGNHRGFDAVASQGGLTIYDGKVTATGGIGGAGIGSGFELNSSDAYSGYVTIYGGTVNATSGNNAAGIGGGSHGHGAMFSMYGGTVTAISHTQGGDTYAEAAGIGGGTHGNSNAISIYGGTVVAKGGSFGAGIGSGRKGAASQIRIYGGDIKAYGGRRGGAGIGSGSEGACRDITISGGKIYAVGNDKYATNTEDHYAAGIGGGYENTNASSTPMNITITGGEITALSAYGGSGIGIGDNSDFYGEINISGGTFIATGGDGGGAGIGGSASVTSKGLYGNIIISGGTITATGKKGAGIGCGGGSINYFSPGKIEITGGTITAMTDNGGAIGGGGAIPLGTSGEYRGLFYASVVINGNPTLILSSTTGRTIWLDNDGNGTGSLTLTGNLAVSTGDTKCAAADRINTLTSSKEARVEPCTHSNIYTKKDANTHTVSCQYCGNTFEESHTTEGVCVCESKDISLADVTDNTSVISKYNRVLVTSVTLSGRTLTKDDNWNTLCLPFDVTIANSPLAGDNVVAKVFDNTSNLDSEGKLTLKFSDAPATITAGTPFIIKWNNTGVNLVNPVFNAVTISSTPAQEVESTDGNVNFVGQYSPFDIDNNNIDEILYVASGNKIGYSKNKRTLKCCRAHFWVKPNEGGTPSARAIYIDWGDNATAMPSIENVQSSMFNVQSGSWYTLNGRRLSVKPTAKGVYISNGRKVVIK